MPDPIKSLFEATKSKKIFLDEADFKSQLSKDPQGVFNAVSDSKLFIDFDDFQNTLGLKKKDVSQKPLEISGEPAAPISPSKSQLPSAPRLTYSDIEGVIAKAVNTGDALRSMRESAKGSSRLGIPGVPTSTEQFARAEAEYKSAMAEKDRILKYYATDINKPVENIIKRGESNLFFDGDVFDEGKARKHVEAVTAKYGGGPLLQEQMVANMRNRLVEEKTQKESKPFIDSALKKRGINMDATVDSVIRSVTQPQLDRAKQLSTEAESKKNQLLETSKTRANELTNTFSSFVDGLNKQIEAGTMTVDQAKILFDQEKNKYQSAIKSVDNEYRSNVQKMNANLRSRYSRIDNELRKLGESFTDSEILNKLPKEQQEAIKEAYLEGQGNYVKFKNEQRKEKDITAGWMMPFGQFTGLLGRGIASGFTGTLASFGDFLIKNGSSNDFSKWLSSFSTEQEKLAPAKYEWSQPIEKFLSITGTTLGGSAPQMLLGGLAAVIPGAQPITAAVASGVAGALSESAVEAGDEFSGALMKGKDVVVAKERADEVYKKNMSNAALYAIGGIGNYLAVGKGKILKGFGLELAEELPLSVNQSYEKAVLDGYKKSKIEFVKENPDILVDTFVGTIGMSAAMGGVGKIFTPITNTVPSGKTQFLQEMVQKSGPDAAKAILDMYANNGIIDENELLESKAKVDQLVLTDEKLGEAGVTGEKAKLITALGDQEKELKVKVQAEQDPAVKAVLQKQLSDLQKDVKGVIDNTTPYITFTLPGGGDMTRTMTVREFNALPQEKQDQAIKSADKIAVINDDATSTTLNEKKLQLGNQPAQDGAYTNGITEPAKAPAMKVEKPTIEERLGDEVMGDVDQKVQMAQSALQATGVKINMIDNTADFEAAVAERKGPAGVEGVFLSDTGEILINKELLAKGIADGRVVWHEASHPVINIVRNTNSPLFDKVIAGMKEAAKTDKAVDAVLNWANDNYGVEGEGVVNDEAVVEMIANMAEGTVDITKLPTGFKQSVIDFVNSIAKALGFNPVLSDTDVAAFKKLVTQISDALTTGRDISEVVGAENVVEIGANIGNPTQLRKVEPKGDQVKVGTGYKLSFVKESDLIDINGLIKDIQDKGQNVWFWVADQLGRGMYYDKVIDGEHYLDAGPSFALDPENRANNIIWATGKGEKWINDKIANSDYIFIISGSPSKSKLFNKRVAEITVNRIKAAIGENAWDVFKGEVLSVSKISKINNIMNEFNSFEELLDSPRRKDLLIEFDNQKEKKGTPLKALLEKYNALMDYETLRDDFYKENDFKQNDVMLVLKPTGFGGQSKHSTYENDVLGEVVGVPDKKINAFEIMPDDFRAKYGKELTRTEQSQAVAPYGVGVRKVQARKANLVSDAGLNKQMTSDDQGNYIFYHYSDRKLKTISPSKFGKNLATGRDERPGIGISMYYTRPDILETGVPSDYGFAVRVPENKVYPFNEDPLDLLPAAEKAFNKKFPGQAFDFNKQVAFVTQEASKRGYPMTVAQWNIRGTKALRAQTTEDFKPEMYREMVPGTTNQYTYNQEIDKFKPNAKRRGQASRGNRISTDTQIINGLYSPIENRINDFKQPKASATKWKEIVGMKSDEAVFSGLSDWLNTKKPDQQLTKEDVLNFMKDNRIEIKEVSKGTKDGESKTFDSLRDALIYEKEIGGELVLNPDGTHTVNPGRTATEYSQYQLPGGENYKEVLITLPFKNKLFTERDELAKKQREAFNSGNYELANEIDNEISRITKKLKEQNSFGTEKEFKSTHFDEPNIITHLRMNTRTDADGKKVLFLEEVQSDWGQKGKREGFIEATPSSSIKAVSEYNMIVNEKNELLRQAADYVTSGRMPEMQSKVDEINNRIEDAKSKLPDNAVVNFDSGLVDIPVRKSIPSAPFVTNTNAWVKLGLKVALKEAVKQGADRIAWTTGEQQNERYDLSKQVDEIRARKNEDGTYKVNAAKDGNNVFAEDSVTANRLPDIVGKELAEKIINDKSNEGKLAQYKGQDLKVGGKGMKAFYGDADNPGIVANVAKALVKELTGKEGGLVASNINTAPPIASQQFKVEFDAEQPLGRIWLVTDNEGSVRARETNRSDAMSAMRELTNRAKEAASKGESQQPAIEITPELRQEVQVGMPQFSRGRRDLDARLKAFAQKERELGSTDQEIEQAIRNRFPLMDQARIDEIMAPVTVAQPTVEEKLETVVQPEGEEKVRGMEKRLGDLDEDTYNKIVDESKTYFSQPNKQTEKAAEEFMKGKSLEYMAEFVTSNPNVPGAVNVWMAAMTAKQLGTEIDAAKKAGDVNRVEMLSAARANIYNHFSAKATELGQTVQAFVSFKNDPAANQFIFNKILKQLEEKGVTGLTDAQKAEIKKMLDDVSTAAAGLPKDMAITKLSHYLGKLTPISAFDIMQAMWYAKILSGITTQSKNFFANMVNTFVEVPVVAMRMSVQTGSLQPIFYAMKGLGGGAIKGLVKAGDILKSGVTSKAEDKFFNNDNLLEYFTWSDTKIGKGFGGAVGKILDFPLLFETSPRALKFVGRSLTASDALFSTANQEAVANMLAFAQAKQEGLKGKVYNRVQQILNNTKQSVVDAKAQATQEGFKPGTVQHKRRVIELVNQKRGEEIVAKAEEMGKRATLTNEPEGFTRGIYLMATKIQETMPISKVMIPFTRIVANVSEMMINFSPAGTYRAVTGIKNPKFSFKFTPSGDNKLTNDQRADLFIKSMIGITALTVLANNIGDDEDDWFDITAGGPTDFAKKYELMKGGWRPYTITFKDGTKISYAEWPVAGALSALGTVLDVDRYGNVEDPEWIDKMVIGAAGYMSSIYDKSLLKGISDFVDIFRPTGKYGAGSDDFIKRTVENTTKFGAQQAKALTLSNFSQQALKLTDEYKDNPIKEAKGAEVFYRDIPIINDGLNPIVDVFGDPVTYATTERLLPWMSVSDEKKDQVLAYLNRNNVFVGMAKEKPMINLDNGEERKMTRQELYEYRKLAGKYTKEFLYENISTLKDINAMENGKEMMKQVVADFTSAARDRAYAEILIK